MLILTSPIRTRRFQIRLLNELGHGGGKIVDGFAGAYVAVARFGLGRDDAESDEIPGGGERNGMTNRVVECVSVFDDMVGREQQDTIQHELARLVRRDGKAIAMDSLNATTMPKKAQPRPAIWVRPRDSPGTNQWAPRAVMKGMVYRKITDLEALVYSKPQ